MTLKELVVSLFCRSAQYYYQGQTVVINRVFVFGHELVCDIST